MKKIILILVLIFVSNQVSSQGNNHVWKLGYGGWFDKGIIEFDSSSYQFSIEHRKMGFEGTEATICDGNGNFLMSSNGVWIANANNDTMMNGSGLNPGSNVNSSPGGLLNSYANVIVPFPGDTNKYVLFHHTDEWDGYSYPTYQLFKSVIDMTLDSGLGGVIQKNDTILSDTLNWGFGACKHANGRDWWIVASKQNSDVIFKILFTANGIASIDTQHLNVPIAYYNVTHLDFSNDGSKFAYYVYDSITLASSVLLFDFGRCSGLFSNSRIIPVTNGSYLWGLSFSPSGKFLYACSSHYIFQIDVANLNIDTVAIYDGFCYPNNPWCTTFLNMYLAANGKIYITSGSGVQHIHEMNFPDSASMACDVQQHSIFLNMWNFRAVPNHPNYYLGRLIGSPCDTVWQGIQEQQHDFHFRIYPNPVTSNILSIGYLLPQNKAGVFSLYDVTGKLLFKYVLPQWSNEQSFSLPDLSNGVYSCVITSNNYRASKKLVVIRE